MKYLLLSTFHQIVVCIMRALPVESSNYLFREISMPPFLLKSSLWKTLKTEVIKKKGRGCKVKD